MRRRLTVAMASMVVAALLATGVVGAVAAVHGTRQQTRRQLLSEATGLAATVTGEAATFNRRNPAQSLHTVLAALRAPLRLDGAAVLALAPSGAFYDPTAARPRRVALPAGLAPARLDPAALLAGSSVSGLAGPLAFAAVPYRATVAVAGVRRPELQVVVLARRSPTGLAAAGLPVLLAAAAVVALAVLVAARLGRRITAPLRDAEEVTARIAAGDLAARVPEPPGTDPELAALAAAINAMAASLAAARGAERQFLMSVSHELRTPLTSIRGFAEAIEDGAVTDAARAAAVIGTEARRLERLVRDLLVLAGLQARRFSLEPVDLDAAEVVAVGAAGFEPTAAELGLAVVVEGGGPVPARADPDRLAQVVANLVENALRHAASEVHVGATTLPGGPGGAPAAAVWVADDGPGIAPGDLGRIFERPFAAGDRSRGPGGGGGRPVGTGLGLAIVAELVAAMGGRVRAESPTWAGGGTRVVVVLPTP